MKVLHYGTEYLLRAHYRPIWLCGNGFNTTSQDNPYLMCGRFRSFRCSLDRRLSLSGSTPPRLLIPTSQNGIIARQTDVFRVLREQSEGSRNVDGGNGNGESPGNSIVQGRVDDSLDL